ncbi:sugar ABC transporter permease, partial [Bifidobacterium breve]|nr:sugar ABC transporter permease [Bifidobacterium breve]MDB1167702.1 sugar ABC transporter permease [Bifidobacterium breve]MDB1170802.1 sugar ABC transporter permease [Bifidobacterium breve]MDB1174585.1 sugar ABC transporter permease [Bifidobacterium breve]MDB1178740.1 sugar ABC transporter permease [Bifidobacterium breve]
MAAASQPTVGILPEEADLHTAEARVNKHKADWRGWKFMWPFTVVFVFVFI